MIAHDVIPQQVSPVCLSRSRGDAQELSRREQFHAGLGAMTDEAEEEEEEATRSSTRLQVWLVAIVVHFVVLVDGRLEKLPYLV